MRQEVPCNELRIGVWFCLNTLCSVRSGSRSLGGSEHPEKEKGKSGNRSQLERKDTSRVGDKDQQAGERGQL